MVTHGVTAVAELKPAFAARAASRNGSHPRRHRRGRIEAGGGGGGGGVGVGGHPRRHRRGRIEALDPDHAISVIEESPTASPPWPN